MHWIKFANLIYFCYYIYIYIYISYITYYAEKRGLISPMAIITWQSNERSVIVIVVNWAYSNQLGLQCKMWSQQDTYIPKLKQCKGLLVQDLIYTLKVLQFISKLIILFICVTIVYSCFNCCTYSCNSLIQLNLTFVEKATIALHWWKLNIWYCYEKIWKDMNIIYYVILKSNDLMFQSKYNVL